MFVISLSLLISLLGVFSGVFALGGGVGQAGRQAAPN